MPWLDELFPPETPSICLNGRLNPRELEIAVIRLPSIKQFLRFRSARSETDVKAALACAPARRSPPDAC